MIDIKYKKIYEEFVKKYEEIHVNPWHEISKLKLDDIYAKLTNEMDINDEYSFKYFMDYIIKRLSGADDAHTAYYSSSLIPYVFKIIENEIMIDYPVHLKGYKLVSINGISIHKVIEELEEIITYGTEGKRKSSIENALFNRLIMFSIPSFRDKNELIYEVEDTNKNASYIQVKKDKKYDNTFDFMNYAYGRNTKYEIVDNCLIYNHTSVMMQYKNLIEEAIKKMEKENLDNIDTIIIDIRGNTGGNSSLNKPVIDFIKRHRNKNLICITNYKVFSGGRFALRDLIELGATTIGEEIGTPINCYGNSLSCGIDNRNIVVARSYFNLCMHIQANSKEQFNNLVTDDILKPIIFKPDILVKQTKDDYINGIDTVLDYAIKYSKTKSKAKY